MIFPGIFLVLTTLAFNLLATVCATRSTRGATAELTIKSALRRPKRRHQEVWATPGPRLPRRSPHVRTQDCNCRGHCRARRTGDDDDGQRQAREGGDGRRRPRPVESTAWSGSGRSTSPTASIRPASTSATAFGIYSNLLVRTLVGYNHVAGAAGNIARAGSRDGPRQDLERRQDLHVQAQAGHQVRPAAEPPDHLGRLQVRHGAHQGSEAGRGLWLLLQRSQERRHAGPADGRLQPHQAARRLPLRLGMPAAGPMPKEVAGG